MLWTARADGVWTHVNPRWEAYTGFPGNAPGLFGFEGALHPDDVTPTVARWTEAVALGTPYRSEYRLRRSDGVYRWHLTRGMPVALPDTDVVWAGACTDIHDQKQAEQESQAARGAAVRALGLALEARDHETKGHTDRVTDLAMRLGAAVGLNQDRLETLRLGAYLHDIGKLTVPDAILLKPGLLTPEERLTMQEHVASGERFSAALGFLSDEVLEVIRGHHERWDGSGYPSGLQASEIPLSARIFALADVYDALVSERPYKQAWTQEQAFAELQRQSGGHFDPELTTLFLEVLGKTALSVNPSALISENIGRSAISEHVQSLALQEAAISVLITDAEQRLVYVNPAFCRLTGYSPEEVIGRNPRFLQGPQTSPADRKILRDALAAHRPVHQLILNYSRSGEELWFEMHVTPIFLQGKLAYFVAIQNDNSVQVADRQQLEWSAMRDAPTGLFNRFSLNRVLPDTSAPLALIFLDLNDLKGINDRHGHQKGDQVLQEVANALVKTAPLGAQVFRLGGDEFLVLIPMLGEAAVMENVTALRQSLSLVETGDGPLTGSFGVAYFPQEGLDLWHLIGLADERMYREKLRQENRRGSSSRN
ncbi:diguanylate cyclase (plasmid) [Deinococcus altitudinis]